MGAIRHLDEVRQVNPAFFELLTFAIALAELYRSLYGWVKPTEKGPGRNRLLADDYYPGDIGFDPLGLKRRIPRSSPRCRRRNSSIAASRCSRSRASSRRSSSTGRSSLPTSSSWACKAGFGRLNEVASACRHGNLVGFI